jgi:putative DNA primase/helicase
VYVDDEEESETHENRKLEPSVVTKYLTDNYLFLTFGERQKEIYRYDEKMGIWKPDGRSFIERNVQSYTPDKSKVNSHLVNEVISHIERETAGADRAIFESSAVPHLILLNGVLNLDTMTLEPFTPDYFMLGRLNVTYNPEADCPVFKQFLSEMLSPEDIRGVQEELGAILAKDYKTKKFSIYLGPPNTGKTTFISVIQRFLGMENVSSVSIQNLASKNPFQVALYSEKWLIFGMICQKRLFIRQGNLRN